MKNIIMTVFILMLLFFQTACVDDQKESEVDVEQDFSMTEMSSGCPSYIAENKENNLNISILLDLSDRIVEDRTVERDTAYLSIISKAFTNHIKSKRLILLEDRMQLFFNPEPTKGKINEIASELQIQFDKNSPKALIARTEELYAKKPIALYQLAREDAEKPEDYPGSDIWRFFKDHVNDYSISDCHRNVLIIITDGYMYYDQTKMTEEGRTSYLTPKSLGRLNLNNSSWKDKMKNQDLGFIKANANLEDLDVMVLGVESKNTNNPYTLDIMQAFWENWLQEMGVRNMKIKNADIPTNVKKVVDEFLL